MTRRDWQFRIRCSRGDRLVSWRGLGRISSNLEHEIHDSVNSRIFNRTQQRFDTSYDRRGFGVDFDLEKTNQAAPIIRIVQACLEPRI